MTAPALWRSAMEPHLPYGLTTQEHTHPLEKETVRFYSAIDLSSVIISCIEGIGIGLRSTVILLDGLTLIFQIDPHVAQGKSDAEESFLMNE